MIHSVIPYVTLLEQCFLTKRKSENKIYGNIHVFEKDIRKRS